MGRVRLITRTTPEGGRKLEVTRDTYAEDMVVEGPCASTTVSASARASDHVYWGSNTFDRVPYTVDVFCSVTLQCQQSEEALRRTKDVALRIAMDGILDNMPKVAGAVEDVVRASFPEHFPPAKEPK